MSNRLTFSLASLTLIFALAFVAMPVIAAPDGAEVSIAAYTGKVDGSGDPAASDATGAVDYVATRSAFIVTVTFSKPVAAGTNANEFGSAGSIIIKRSAGAGEIATDVTVPTPAVFPGSTDQKKYTLKIDMGDTNYESTRLVVSIPADTIMDVTAEPKGNQASTGGVFTSLPKATDWTITASIGTDKPETTGGKLDGGDGTVAGTDTFDVNFTFSGGTGAFPAIPSGQIQVKDAAKGTAIATTVIEAPTSDLTAVGPTATGQFTVVATATAVDPVKIGINPNWANAVPVGGLRIPAQGVTETPPEAMITTSGLNETDRTFRIEVTFTPAAKSDGSAGSAITGFDSTKLDIKDSSDAVVLATVEAERKDDNSYVAILKYDQLAVLPLTVKVKQDVQKTSNPDHSATVGTPGTTTPTPTDEDPSVAIMVSNHDAATRQFRVQVTITPGMKADGTAGDPITAFGLSDLEITDAGDAAVTVTTIDERFTAGTATSPAGMYVAILQYNPLAVLPLTITTVDAFATSDDPTTTAMVPPGATTPTPTPPGAPDAPTLTMAEAGDMEVALTWTAATTGDAAESFEYRVDGGTEMAIADSTATTTTHTVTGLTNGTEYDFEVRGVNTAGGGAWSNLMSATPMAVVTPDTTPPTVMIEVMSKDADGRHRVDTDGMVRFKLIFSELLAKAPSLSRLQVLDIDIVDHNMAPITGATLSDATAEGDGEYYTLTVPAPAPRMPLPVNRREPEREVHIEIGTRGVGDMATPEANHLGGTPESRMAKFDTIPPTVVITPGYFTSSGAWVAATKGEPMAKLAFEFDFSEPLSPEFSTSDIEGSPAGANFRLLRDSDPQPVMGKDDAFTVIVTPIDVNAPTTVQIERLEVEDAAKNKLQDDVLATYTPTTQAPVASIRVDRVHPTTRQPLPFYCGVTGNWVTVTITDNEAIKAGEVIAKSEITVSAGWKISSHPSDFRASPASAGAKSVTARFKVVRNDVENASDRTWLGVQEVKITVAASAVKDNTDQVNAAKAMSYTAGPVITVPAGAYVVIIRDNIYTWRYSHLNEVRTLFLGDFNVRADNIDVQGWDCMPDLGLIFDTTVDASPGIGGGGLMVLQSRDHDTTKPIAKGTVGISEIMWSEDRGVPFGSASNLEHAREQWIELHNTNTFDVKVTLFELIRTEAYRTNDAGRANLIDVMSNYDIGGRWTVKGSDGNSDLGKDFVSMKRVAPAADKNYAHGEKQGRNAGHWSASTSIYLTRRAELAHRGIQLPAEDLNYSYFGSPGRANTFSAPGPIDRSPLPKDIIFNEVSNRRDQTLEWIELKNVSGGELNLKKYQISYVTAKGTDKLLYNFPDNDNIKLADGELLLLLDTDPRDNDAHPIAVAFNRDGGNDQGLGIGPNAIKYKVANFAEGGLPDDGKFLLLIRNRNDRLGKLQHDGEKHIRDAIGYDDDLKDDSRHTNVWPFDYFNGSLDARNTIAVETVHRRQHVIDPDKNTHGDDKDEHQALRDVGYTGIGYKRHAQRIAVHGGTPGYEDTRKNLVADVAGTGVLTISEIMYDQGDGRYPQWIEIYNSSDLPVNLHSEAGWRLVIENYDDPDLVGAERLPIETLSGTLNFKNSDVQTILPGQTVMVTSTRARNSGSAFFDTRVVFPATRVFSAWDDQRGELTLAPDKGGRPTDPILSDRGFYIELIDGKGNLSDGVGNLVKSPNRRVASTLEWELSDVVYGMKAKAADGRSSILRRYGSDWKNNVRGKKYTAAEVLKMGIQANGWIAASETDFLNVRQTWYGHQDDYGSPGITGGQVLPVSLSKFRPERLESGAVVIRWITESELNNAGFNILRSEKSDGEFKQINTKLIAGQGTTSERTTYTHTDTSAKPNVVYYYQIQDVSLDGKVQTLRMSRLKGHISAAGKATMTWGELKALQ